MVRPGLTRSSLLERLRVGCDHASWEEFFDQYWQMIFHVARRAGLSEADAQDVVQETVVEAVACLPRFERQREGSFRSWLCQITRSRVARHYRKEYQLHRRVNALTEEHAARPMPGAEPDLEAIWDEEWQRNLLWAALERVKRQVSPRHYQIFHCHVLQEWDVAEVARQLDVSQSMVYVTKHRVGALLKRELTRMKEEV